MLDQASAERLRQAAQMAGSGHRAQAAEICREVLAAHPDELPALLWLGYTSPDQVESENAIARAYDLQPQDPNVLKAVDWYNRYFVDPSPSPAQNGAAPAQNQAPSSEQPAANIMHTPVGEPVRDAQNFFMSQHGSMVIGSTIVLVINLAIFVTYTFVRGFNWTPFGLPRIFYALIALGLALIAAGFLFFAVRDVLSPPSKAHGFISNRREVRREVKTDVGMTTEYYYELDFISDEARLNGGKSVHLTLTKEQFEASERSNRAYVVYSPRLGTVRLYQPLRSVY